MRIGVIVDHGRIAAWQAMALKPIGADNSFIVYNCTNSPFRRKSWRHALYYVLNLASLRTRLTRRVSIERALSLASKRDFECASSGSWETLPNEIVERMLADRIDVVVKFGMGLLRVPDPTVLPVPILSYHHGDPREFRGRPAGFYELLYGRDRVGQVVQLLSNKLDAGSVVAFAQTSVHRHSYRRTMAEAYRASPYLLIPALSNFAKGITLPLEPTGANYRLPSNITVARFVLARAAALIKRLIYGAFFEKRWSVAMASSQGPGWTQIATGFPSPDQWRGIGTPKGYRFIADPFFNPAGGILVEGLRERNSRGEILSINDARVTRVSGQCGHMSYPSPIQDSGSTFVIAETCDWSPTRIFRFDGSAMKDMGLLDVAGCPSLIDPTMVEYKGSHYLFANRLEEGGNILRLWVADSLFGRFEEHPMSPIGISPVGGRMAGAVGKFADGLYRIGQDSSRGYGDGVAIFKIHKLSRFEYEEQLVDRLRFGHVRGPHTVNIRGSEVLFDYFVERFSLLAGFRRIFQRLKLG